MTLSSQELQSSIFKVLAADTTLVENLGGLKLFERMPERAQYPYVVLGRQTISDWSTSTEDGEAIVFFVHVWSRAKNYDQSSMLQDRIKYLLTETLSDLPTQKLIHLRFQLAETRRDRLNGHLHSIMRFRAVIEPN